MRRFLAGSVPWMGLCGLLVGSLFLALGFRHETQDEFYGHSGEVDYLYCFKIFGSWFLIGSVMGLIAYGARRAVGYFVGRSRS